MCGKLPCLSDFLRRTSSLLFSVFSFVCTETQSLSMKTSSKPNRDLSLSPLSDHDENFYSGWSVKVKLSVNISQLVKLWNKNILCVCQQDLRETSPALISRRLYPCNDLFSGLSKTLSANNNAWFKVALIAFVCKMCYRNKLAFPMFLFKASCVCLWQSMILSWILKARLWLEDLEQRQQSSVLQVWLHRSSPHTLLVSEDSSLRLWESGPMRHIPKGVDEESKH